MNQKLLAMDGIGSSDVVKDDRRRITCSKLIRFYASEQIPEILETIGIYGEDSEIDYLAALNDNQLAALAISTNPRIFDHSTVE